MRLNTAAKNDSWSGVSFWASLINSERRRLLYASSSNVRESSSVTSRDFSCVPPDCDVVAVDVVVVVVVVVVVGGGGAGC